MSLLSEIVVPGGEMSRVSEIGIRTNKSKDRKFNMSGGDGGGSQSKSV